MPEEETSIVPFVRIFWGHSVQGIAWCVESREGVMMQVLQGEAEAAPLPQVPHLSLEPAL